MKRFITACAILLGGLPLLAAEEERPAQWIGLNDPAGRNAWICFRKVISLKAGPEKAPARIACDSKYWLWINGKLVIREGGLKRGPTPDGTYVDVQDLAPHLKEGANSIAILLWYFGKHGFSHNDSGKAGLVFELNADGTKYTSDESWKVTRHPAFGSTGDPHPNFRLAEANVFYDAGKEPGGWTEREFDDSTWAPAIEFGAPPCAPWGPLVERPIPQWKDFGLRAYVNAAELNLPRDGGETPLVARLPYNAQVTPWFRITAPAGMRIGIETDNYRGGGTESVRAEYVTREGEQEFECPGWMNGHDVRYGFPEGVKVLELKYRETGFNAEFAGTFTCDDPMLNELWKKSQRTLYVTMRDNYMDCPDRERAQWWGDAVNELGEAFYVFDPPAYALTRKAMLELARWQRPHGTLYSPVPAGIPGPKAGQDGSWSKELPPQMLASVGHYGFWTYYLYTGDAATIREVYPAVRKYLNIWKLDGDGLVIHRKGDWDWHDWGKDIDAAVLDSAWYYTALRAAVEMARLCDAQDDLPEWNARMKAIEAGFNRKFWDGKEYRSPAYQGDTDDRANAMAVCAGLAGAKQFGALREVLTKHRNAGPYMEKYVLEALYLMNAPDLAIERAKQRYADQIASELTTLWEGWGIGAKGFGGGTYNHAWSGGPLTMLSQHAAGVAPVEPGYGKFQVMPRMGPLARIETVVPTVKGNIDLQLQNAPARFAMKLKVPDGTSALVGIPGPGGRPVGKLEVNGRPLEFRAAKPPADGLRFKEEKDGFAIFEVPQGVWFFEALAP